MITPPWQKTKRSHGRVRRRWALGTLWGVGAVVAQVILMAQPAAAIVGGAVANPSDYPYFVKVHLVNAECAGSIVGDSWILTAAHCTTDTTSATQVSVDVTGRGRFPATQLVVHPLYNNDLDHDLALVRLPPGATAGIAAPQVGAAFDWYPYAADAPALVMGYGYTGPAGPGSPALRVASTVIRGDAYMNDIFDPWYWFDNWVDPIMIGAGSASDTTCVGDSGSPLMSVPYGRPIQVGVASFGYGSIFDAGCNDAGGFAELSNAQLAWVASLVPAVSVGWGACSTSTGSPGQPVVNYTSSYVPGASPDGPNYWAIWCVGQPATVIVPDLTGDSASQAIAGLQAVGLGLGSRTLRPANSCELINKVMDQNPAPGAVLAPASVVSVTIGTRPNNPCF